MVNHWNLSSINCNNFFFVSQPAANFWGLFSTVKTMNAKQQKRRSYRHALPSLPVLEQRRLVPGHKQEWCNAALLVIIYPQNISKGLATGQETKRQTFWSGLGHDFGVDCVLVRSGLILQPIELYRGENAICNVCLGYRESWAKKNEEKVRDMNRNYWVLHKEEKKAYNKEYNKLEIECEVCECRVRKCNWARHLVSRKHMLGGGGGKVDDDAGGGGGWDEGKAWPSHYCISVYTMEADNEPNYQCNILTHQDKWTSMLKKSQVAWVSGAPATEDPSSKTPRPQWNIQEVLEFH